MSALAIAAVVALAVAVGTLGFVLFAALLVERWLDNLWRWR